MVAEWLRVSESNSSGLSLEDPGSNPAWGMFVYSTLAVIISSARPQAKAGLGQARVVHHCVYGPNSGSHSGGRWIIKNRNTTPQSTKLRLTKM